MIVSIPHTSGCKKKKMSRVTFLQTMKAHPQKNKRKQRKQTYNMLFCNRLKEFKNDTRCKI